MGSIVVIDVLILPLGKCYDHGPLVTLTYFGALFLICK